MATNISQDDFHKTGLRLPKDLHLRLHEAAAESGRSYNSEIVSRLEQSFNIEPLTTVKRDELLKLVNDAIDARMEGANQSGQAALHTSFSPSEAVKSTQPVRAHDLKESGSKGAPVNKVILVPGLGSDTGINYLPERVAAVNAAEKTPPNTGPTRSPNARKRIPK